jgi:dUTP pyrophosphatase
MILKIKKLDPKAIIPTRANPTDAGADLYALEDIRIQPNSRELVRTGISLEVPESYYARIAPRSGLAYKSGIDVLAGVVDSSYRGEVGVILLNTDSQKIFNIRAGDRIAQLIIEAHYNMTIKEVDSLSDTTRGDGGFGSTG